MLKKRLLSFLLAVVFVLSLSTVAFAAEAENEDQSNASTRSVSSNASYTVIDSDGNRFKITGTSYPSVNVAASSTSYSTTHYHEGTTTQKDALDAMTKTVRAGGTVYMSNGLLEASTTYGGYAYLTGASGQTVKISDTLIYSIVSIFGTHYFSCNGGSDEGSSYYSLN